jgi:hypothetical protein
MTNSYFRPHTLQGRVVLRRGLHKAIAGIEGRGSTILLNKGGAGAASSYSDIGDYKRTVKGIGMGGAIEDKLRNLKVKPMETKKKSATIKFSI